MKKIAGKIAMILILIMLANCFTSCTIVAVTLGIGGKILGLAILADAMCIGLVLLRVLLFGFNSPHPENDYLTQIEESEFMETVNSLPETENRLLMETCNSLSETEIASTVETFNSLDETSIGFFMDSLNSLSEGEIVSSLKAINSLNEEQRQYVLLNALQQQRWMSAVD